MLSIGSASLDRDAPDPSMVAASDSAQQAFVAHRGFLWSIAYRMVGSAADADDVVQDAFVRALERPPARLDESLRPWLTRVTMNLARDRLRARKRAGYVGPWLPAPIEHDPLAAELAEAPELSPSARYDLRESASFAFLLALEALTPNQRAVLLMRDVLDASVEETADVLGLSAANVKVQHHRARKRLETYERTREASAASRERSHETLARFLACLASGDLDGLQELLADDVRILSDGGGEFHAARVPVVGAAKAIRFLLNIRRWWSDGGNQAIKILNGEPAFVGEVPATKPSYPSRIVTRIEVDGRGKIREIHSVLATAKLGAVFRGDDAELTSRDGR